MEPADVKTMIDETGITINKLHSELSNLYSLRYKALIHYLIKKGLVTLSDMSSATGLTETSIYKYIDDIEEINKV